MKGSEMKSKMDRRQFLKTCSAIAAGGFVLSNQKLDIHAGPRRPNIIVILVDDMGYSDLGCYGSEIDTPNIDKLAYDGIRFSQFYNTAKCAPTRTCLLSGQYYQDAGSGIDRGITMAHAMKAADYRTLAVGKWHLNGNPVDRGFDRYFGHLSGASDYFAGNDSWHLDSTPFTDFGPGFYSTDAKTDYALDFIDEAHTLDPKKPFFMYLAYNAPHSPLQAWQSDIDKYRNGRFTIGWDQMRQNRYNRQVEMGLIKPEWPLSPRSDNIPAWDTLTEEEKDFEDSRIAAFAAMIDRIDQNVGRIVSKLEELKKDKDTLIMFLSDNGGSPFDRTKKYDVTPGTPESKWLYGVAWANVSDTPFRFYKRNQHEGGISTPFIAHWPRLITKKGAVTDQCGHLIDIMPTVIELAGWKWPGFFDGEPQQPLPGKSLVPIFEGKKRDGHEVLYFQFINHRAILKGDFKLVSDWAEPWELYNLREDRTELNDLITQYPQKAAELEKLWYEWWDNRGNSYKNGETDHPPYYYLGGEIYEP